MSYGLDNDTVKIILLWLAAIALLIIVVRVIVGML